MLMNNAVTIYILLLIRKYYLYKEINFSCSFMDRFLNFIQTYLFNDNAS